MTNIQRPKISLGVVCRGGRAVSLFRIVNRGRIILGQIFLKQQAQPGKGNLDVARADVNPIEAEYPLQPSLDLGKTGKFAVPNCLIRQLNAQ